jgi:hypothetical protein
MSPVEDAQRRGAPNNMDDTMKNDIGDVAPRTPIDTQVPKDGATIDPSPKTPKTPKSPSFKQVAPVETEDLMNKIFQFLSTATPGSLLGVAVGLAAVTYVVIGQFGLVLIGAFAGVVLFIQWEQRNAGVGRVVKGERGLDVLARLLEEKEQANPGILSETDANELRMAIAHSFDNLPAETREAMNELIDAVVNNYVKWWYNPIVPSDNSFPLSCRRTLTSFLATISGHLSRKRPADAFLDFLTNSSSIVIVFFSELSNAFAELPSDSKVSATDAIHQYLASNADSNLANLLNQRQQAAKFRMISEDLLGFLDRSAYECDTAKVFLREILAGIVLEMTLQTCSKAEWINSWIVYLLEAGEPDFNQAIDVGMQTGPSSETAFLDLDGNVGNISVTKGNRNSFDMEKARRKEVGHKKKLSKADEEMEMAMEEMKRMNEMIAQADSRISREIDKKEQSELKELPEIPDQSTSAHGASELLADAFKRNADELKMQSETAEAHVPSEGEPRSFEKPETGSLKESGSDGLSSKDEVVHTPVTPISTQEISSQASSPKRMREPIQEVAPAQAQAPASAPAPAPVPEAQFTNFDQILQPGTQEETETSSISSRSLPPLSLHNAHITLLDEPGDKGRIRNKPNWDYLIQIEPDTANYPGWMIVRKYSDFEKLHEIIRRIATISGASSWSEQHNALPSWKVHTRTSLRGELERYVRDALWFQSLAESEGMKRFLEKDFKNLPVTNSKLGFQAIEKLGKNVFDVLTTAPVEGSKAVVGGVTGVLGNIGLGLQKRPTIPSTAPAPATASSPTSGTPPVSSSLQDVTAASRISISNPPNGARKPRDSMDSQRSSSIVSLQPGRNAHMDRRPSYNSIGDADSDGLRVSRSETWERALPSSRNSREHSRASSIAPMRSPSRLSLDGLKLPPPPDAIPDDYESPISPRHHGGVSPHHIRSNTSPNLSQRGFEIPLKGHKQYSPLTEPETRVAVELLFAIINELYTLSSAWNIRRTLLAAAKSFLLRPGNPSLTSIQNLIQTSVIEANTSDAGIAAHLRKLRENTMPTDAERALWPAELTAEEKEKLRVKARRLLIRSGVPAALMGVMGQSATSEALGRIFDSLQNEEVARGLMFGVMLQAVRTVTH